jgi:hypothetical protein
MRARIETPMTITQKIFWLLLSWLLVEHAPATLRTVLHTLQSRLRASSLRWLSSEAVFDIGKDAAFDLDALLDWLPVDAVFSHFVRDLWLCDGLSGDGYGRVGPQLYG